MIPAIVSCTLASRMTGLGHSLHSDIPAASPVRPVISDMVRMAAITEADTSQAPPKRSPEVVGGNPLRFRRLGFVLKFYKKRCGRSFSWAGALFRQLCLVATI